MIEKYKKLSLPVKAGIWFAVLQYAQEAVIVISTPFFTRLMSSEAYGIVNVYNTWQGILTVFLTLRLTSGIYQIQLFEYKEDRENLTSSLLVLSTLFTLVGTLLLAVFRMPVSKILELPTEMIIVMLIDIWAQMVLSFWLTRNRFEYNYRPCLIIVLLNCFVRTVSAIGLVCVYSSNQAFYKVLGNAIPETIIAIVLLLSMLIKGHKWLKYAYWKEAVKFNVVLIPGYLSGILLASSDRLMINTFCGSSEVAKYSIAYSCAQLIQLFFSAINWVFTPYAYECLDIKRYDSLRKTANLLTVLMASLTALLIAFAPEAIAIFAPASYKSAIWVIPPATCGIFLTFVYGFFTNTEYFYKKNVYITVATLIGAVVNILLNWLLIPRIGYIAASYTTLIGYVIMTIIHYYYYRRIVSERIYNVHFITICTLALYIFGSICLALYSHPILRYVVMIVIMSMLAINRKRVISMIREMKSMSTKSKSEES